ncbi:TetR/AcrR family transcriptional regulator [Zoogloea sp. LCSB751]|uniref:TetR/AcrR family transcriptional regulator n=1 Tax=Zoogloea sp. LCSB751 TaxID=1965277 RepID=UPI0009A4EE48|nr:TetR family transcriptional regulator [Zoogloea sp. LCSB751]
MSARGGERRELILQAAMRVLVRDGAHGFRMRAIAAEAGVGISHVQYYYKTLDVVIEAVMAHYLEGWDVLMADAPTDLAGALDFMLNCQLQHGDCQLLWELWAMSGRNQAAEAALRTFYASYTDRVCELVCHGFPDATPASIRARAVLIVALIEGLSILRGNGRETELAPHARQHVIDAVLALAALPLVSPPQTDER